MPGSEIKISVVIINFHSERFLPACLRSLYEKIASRIKTEIIIVNNDKREKLETVRADFPEVIILDNGYNQGFGEGCNRGARVSQGRYLFFLNPDTEIISDNAEELLDFFQKNGEAGIVGSCLVTEKGQVQKWSAGAAVNLYDLARNNLGLSRSHRIWESKIITKAFWVAGTALFISKKLFEALKGFDENISMYFEDVDLCKRVRKSGFEVYYFPSFKVLHRSGESFSDKGDQKKNYYASQQYYFEKHCGRIQAVLIKIIRKILI
jgi:GT2 family glycosyltransferase